LHVLLRRVPDLPISEATIFDDSVVAKHEAACWNKGATATVAKRIDVFTDLKVRLGLQPF
jgi:hypothetical protein